jgi:hypothetical protein
MVGSDDNRVGMLRQFFSRVAYELRLRNTYYMPQANVKIIGPSAGALVMDDFATVARVQLRGQPITGVFCISPRKAVVPGF